MPLGDAFPAVRSRPRGSSDQDQFAAFVVLAKGVSGDVDEKMAPGAFRHGVTDELRNRPRHCGQGSRCFVTRSSHAYHEVITTPSPVT